MLQRVCATIAEALGAHRFDRAQQRTRVDQANRFVDEHGDTSDRGGDGRIVLAIEGGVSAQVLQAFARIVGIAAASVMDHHDRRIGPEFIASIGDALAEIDFLGVHEEAFVKAAEALPERASNEHERARDHLNLLWRACVERKRARA